MPIMAGVVVGSRQALGHRGPLDRAGGALRTTLAPIAGRFGWGWGIVAGFIHSSAAQTVGALHGGLNLYNNGFAAGIVASALTPVIFSISARLSDHPRRNYRRTLARLEVS